MGRHWILRSTMRTYKRHRLTILSTGVVLASLVLIFISFRQLVNLKKNLNIDEPFTEIVRWKTSIPVLKRRSRAVPCQDLKQPWGLAKEDSWQPIGFKEHYRGELKEAAFVYSAYYEDTASSRNVKKVNSIRIVGIFVSDEIRHGLLCQVWFVSKQELSVVPATYIDIPEGIDKLYKPCFFRCVLHSDEVPYAVSLVRKKCTRPTNFLSVHRITNISKRKFTVCVSPINNHFNKVHQLIEMIEVNRLFGAEKFIFYNHSMGSDVAGVLAQLQEEALVEIHQWRIPVRVNSQSLSHPEEIHYYGQLSALNDCLFRESFSDYIVFTDLDELIVPRKHANWSELLMEVDQATSDIYVFRCVFFKKEWPDTTIQFQGKSVAEKYKLLTLLKLNRESKIFPYFSRSKVIVRPGAVLAVGIHNVWMEVPSARESLVDVDLGLLHHYRDWENPDDNNRFLDKTMQRFSTDILLRVQSRWKTIRLKSQDMD